MPSVRVSWSGRCGVASVRAELCGKIGQIVEALQGRLPADYVAIRLFDEILDAPIMLDNGLFSTPPIAAELTRAGVESLLSARGLRVYGIEFSLPTLYLVDNRASFVFIVDDHPDLDGVMVHFAEAERPSLLVSLNVSRAHDSRSGTTRVTVEDVAHVRATDALRESVNASLTTPRIHLRYNFESWLDDLLGWVKHFYIPDLWFWRYEDVPGYDRFLAIDPGDASAREACFDNLRRMQPLFGASQGTEG